MTTLSLTRTVRTPFGKFEFRAGRFLLHAALLTIGLIYIYPFVWMVGSAFKTPGGFFTQGISPFPSVAEGFQWDNFVQAWNGANFSRYFLNSVVITVATTFFATLFVTMAAFALARLRVRGRNLILLILGATFFLPQGYTIIPIFQIVRALGLLNTISAVIIVGIAGGQVYGTIITYGFMRSIPREVEEAAIIDGATIFQRYWYVILPMARPVVATLVMFFSMWTWNSFFIPLVFTLGRPELRTLTVGMFAFVGERSSEWTLMCAAATISLLPIVLVYIFLQRYFIEGVAGAIKA
jgi:ABC-type glycerol-3-phosphate transport system permease component